jgi:hypothetical protein
MKAQIGGPNPGGLIGHWCKRYGEGTVAEAHWAAMAHVPADYVPWMTKRLEAVANRKTADGRFQDPTFRAAAELLEEYRKDAPIEPATVLEGTCFGVPDEAEGQRRLATA